MIDKENIEELKELLFNSDNPLYNVYTPTEAAVLWGKEESTVRKAIQNGKFEFGVDYRKSGRITFITKAAMKKVFGEPKEMNIKIE